MNRKMVRGVIVLITLVGIAGFFLQIGQKTDTGPKKVFNAPSDEVMQKIEDVLAAQKAQEAAKPLPSNEGTGHRHADGTWHEGEHETPPVPFADSEEIDSLVDAEEIKEVLRIYSDAGLDFNYTSPLTPEEQVEYDRLKVSLAAEGIQRSHTGLKLTAKMLVSTRKMQEMMADRKAGRITAEELRKLADEHGRTYYYGK